MKPPHLIHPKYCQDKSLGSGFSGSDDGSVFDIVPFFEASSWSHGSLVGWFLTHTSHRSMNGQFEILNSSLCWQGEMVAAPCFLLLQVSNPAKVSLRPVWIVDVFRPIWVANGTFFQFFSVGSF